MFGKAGAGVRVESTGRGRFVLPHTRFPPESIPQLS
jgi:hypothetical protein